MARKKIVVLTGAGVSAESGLSTYRDSGGTWDNYDPMVVASIQGWNADPAAVLEFYNGLRTRMAACRPNSAHLDIAALEKDHDVTVVTQNVDDLHERAGSTHLIHLHGEATKVRPEDTFNDRDSYSERAVVDVGYGPVRLGDKDARGVQLRPHIVFFGEAVPRMEDAIRSVEAADIVLIVGTSLQVYPAASLYHYAGYDIPVFIIDPKDVPAREKRVTHIQDVATRGMKTFLEKLRAL
ncbi:MAG: NAD-dependent deacylase [Bacteroidales bacterium]|nr:NAD-dependent deacylase [Bacteroidales bacterium]